jgi:predicted  nucleic acid-binding Zn-ribbon protein/ribosomal protein S27E
MLGASAVGSSIGAGHRYDAGVIEREEHMEINCANCGAAVAAEGDPGESTDCKCGNTITVPEKPPKQQFGVVHCTNCWKRYGVVGRPAGTRFKCKSCGQIIMIKQGGGAKGAAAAPKSKRTAGGSGGGLGGGMASSRAASRETTATAEFEIPGQQRRAPAPSKQQTEEIAALRSTIQKYKGTIDEKEALAKSLQTELDDKSRLLGEREAELSRQVEEGRTLQERNSRQAAEIGALEQEIATRAEESASLNSQKEDLEKLLKIRDDDVTARDERVKQLEAELKERPTREETKKFYEDKEAVEKRLEEGGSKLSAMKEAISKLRTPLAEALKRFDELGGESGSIDLPDFTGDLAKAKQEAEERRLAFNTLKTELESEKHTTDMLKHQKDDLSSEVERTRKELAAARKAYEEVLRAAEEEIEQLAATSSTAEQRKGFLRGLFGGRSSASEAPKPRRATSSRLKIRAAAGIPGASDDDVAVEDEIAEADDVAIDEPMPPVDDLEVTDPVEEAEPISDDDTLALPDDIPDADDDAIADAEEIAEADDLEEAEEIEEAEEEPKPKPAKKRGRLRKRRG